MLALMAAWLTPTSLFIILNVMIGTIFLISRLSPLKPPHHHRQFEHDDGRRYNPAPPVLQRSPSLLDRVRSFNFSTYYGFPLPDQDRDLQPDNNLAAQPLEQAPSILERVKSIKYSPRKSSPQNPNLDDIQPTGQDYTNPRPPSRSPCLLERVKSMDFTTFYRSDSIKTNQHTTTEEADLDMDMNPVHGQVKICKSESSKVIQRKSPDKKMKKSANENSRLEAEEEDQKDEEDHDGQGVDAKADDFINKFKQQLKLERWDSFLRYRDMHKGKVTKDSKAEL